MSSRAWLFLYEENVSCSSLQWHFTICSTPGHPWRKYINFTGAYFLPHDFKGPTNTIRRVSKSLTQEQERRGRKVRKKRHGQAQRQRQGADESNWLYIARTALRLVSSMSKRPLVIKVFFWYRLSLHFTLIKFTFVHCLHLNSLLLQGKAQSFVVFKVHQVSGNLQRGNYSA